MTIHPCEQADIDRANRSGRQPVVFVHGLWLLPNSWDHWRTAFEEQGFVTLAPGWPDDPATDLDVLGRAQWWAEIFNTPCVAYAHKLDDAGALVETSAEFIAFEAAIWAHADGPAKAMERARFYCRFGAGA